MKAIKALLRRKVDCESKFGDPKETMMLHPASCQHMSCGSAFVNNHDLLLPHPLSPLPSEENLLVVVDYYSRFFDENIISA